MELSLFHMGSIGDLTAEQCAEAEKFINEQTYGVVATNDPQTGARLSCLNNIPGQTLDKLYFATDYVSGKITNLKSDSRFEVAYTDGNNQLFLSGNATVVEDKEMRRAKWLDYFNEYFKGGPDGEQYCLIEFCPSQTRIMLMPKSQFDFVKLTPVHIIGIAVRTSNGEQQTTNAIGNLWERFWSEGIIPKIPNKLNGDLYAIYTEYDSDATAPYTMVIGCPVSSLEEIPHGMKGITIEGGNYAKTNVTGKLSEGVVQKGWMSVWMNKELDRTYKTDFELYKCDGSDPDHAEVDIFVGVK